MEFKPWPKISRIESPVTISEKLDGTNSCVIIDELTFEVGAQSRNKIITPKDDNAGFAKWVFENQETLKEDLGPGYHFGEWWGLGIQRNYGQKQKRFSLFNTRRFNGATFKTPNMDSVKVVYEGPFDMQRVDVLVSELRTQGSFAVPGWAKPEGLVVYFQHNDMMLKVILDK